MLQSSPEEEEILCPDDDTEFLRASIALTIAFIYPAQERSEENCGRGVAITFCFSTSSLLMAASQLLMKNKGSVS